MNVLDSWLWPDHNIGKRESRGLREDHNRLVNVASELLETCELAYVTLLNSTERLNRQHELCRLRDAIALATGRESRDVQDSYEEAALRFAADPVYWTYAQAIAEARKSR